MGLRCEEWHLAWWDVAGPAAVTLPAPSERQEIGWHVTGCLEGWGQLWQELEQNFRIKHKLGDQPT